MDGRASVSTSLREEAKLTFHETAESHTGEGGEERLGVRQVEDKPELVLLTMGVLPCV